MNQTGDGNGGVGSAPSIETATLGGGCFWCLEAVFESVKGVTSVKSGYARNHLLLALTLLDLAPERREEAVALLRAVGDLEPRPTMRVEDLTIRAEARTQLATLEGAQATPVAGGAGAGVLSI